MSAGSRPGATSFQSLIGVLNLCVSHPSDCPGVATMPQALFRRLVGIKSEQGGAISHGRELRHRGLTVTPPDFTQIEGRDAGISLQVSPDSEAHTLNPACYPPPLFALQSFNA